MLKMLAIWTRFYLLNRVYANCLDESIQYGSLYLAVAGKIGLLFKATLEI